LHCSVEIRTIKSFVSHVGIKSSSFLLNPSLLRTTERCLKEYELLHLMITAVESIKPGRRLSPVANSWSLMAYSSKLLGLLIILPRSPRNGLLLASST
jgi:hypothetical protein